MADKPKRDRCGYCGKEFSVTLSGRQLVCMTKTCPAKSEYTGPVRDDG